MVRELLSSPAMLLLAAAAVVLLVLWLRTRERRFAVLLGIASAMLLLFGLWKTFGPETAAQQIKRKLYAMSAGVAAKNVDRVAEHVSDEFDYGGLDKPAMKRHVGNFIETGQLTDIKMWDDQPAKFLPVQPGKNPTATIEFKTKPVGDVPQEVFLRCVATFVLDGDGQWRLKGFELFTQPGNNPLRVPQLPLH